MNLLINQIKSAQSGKEVRHTFEMFNVQIDEQYTTLISAVEELNMEVESDISSGNIDLALWKMSTVVMLEDITAVTERVLLKRGILV